MQKKSYQIAKIGVTVVSVSRKRIHSGIHKRHRREVLSNNQNLEETKSISIPFDQYKSETFSHTSIHSSILELHEISSIKDVHHPISTTSSFNKSFTFSKNDDASSILLRTKSVEEYREQKPNKSSRRYTKPIIAREFKKSLKDIENNENNKRNRRRRIYKICPAYFNYCCLSAIIGILLFLFGIAALLVFIFTTKHITTTTTSTTSTTTTTTSSTSSTSTSTTCECFLLYSDIVSILLSYSYLQARTTTTTSTTTPTPPCTPTSVGSASTLYTTSSGSGTSYTCFAYEWTSPTTGLVTLAFELRHDPDLWFLDDVSVYAGAVQMLSNTGFETGSLSPWVRTTPYGSCWGTAGHSCSSYSSHSGNYEICDGSNGCADRISQQFMATAGQVYIVSFWLKSGSTGSTISAKVTLS
ncbi:unnamed protein product [Rotaria sp. Silwood2]|nr:unnamed protein product [Rotaria sp. Silwood2]CAF4299414.1 unnamed protein product [Rotaria sp. Silwood2]